MLLNESPIYSPSAKSNVKFATESYRDKIPKAGEKSFRHFHKTWLQTFVTRDC